MYVSNTMALNPRRKDIRAMQRRLRDEISGEQNTLKVSGSVEEVSIRLDPDAERQQRWATTILGQA